MVTCLAQGLEQNKCTLRKTQNNGSAVVIFDCRPSEELVHLGRGRGVTRWTEMQVSDTSLVPLQILLPHPHSFPAPATGFQQLHAGATSQSLGLISPSCIAKSTEEFRPLKPPQPVGDRRFSLSPPGGQFRNAFPKYSQKVLASSQRQRLN